MLPARGLVYCAAPGTGAPSFSDGARMYGALHPYGALHSDGPAGLPLEIRGERPRGSGWR